MNTSRIRVAVVYGGASTEHSISCISAGAVMEHLPGEFEIIPVGITRSGAWTQGSLTPVTSDLPEVPDGRRIHLSLDPQRRGQFLFDDGTLFATVDVVFPVLHGPNGEDGTVQGLLDLSGVPYVGNGVLASAVSMDKEFTKKIVGAVGLPITPELILDDPDAELSEADRRRLGLPVFVKPARGGSSIGISRVVDWGELPAALRLAFAKDSKIVIEAEVRGDEVEVGVLEFPDGRVEASVPARLVGTGDSAEGFYGFETKYLDDVVSAEIPARLPADTIGELRRMAVRTFRALGCRGLARVDFFVTEEGPVLNEVNTLPGFTPISMFPKVFAAEGISYPELLRTLVMTALSSTSGASPASGGSEAATTTSRPKAK